MATSSITGMEHIMQRKSIGNGGMPKARSLATWLEVLMTILVWVMIGRPRIMLTVTLGPAATRRLAGDPSRVK